MQPLNILLVDDEPLKLDLISEWLVGFYCHINYATSYASAIDKICDSYDIVICDYFLNKEDKNNPGTGKIFKDTYCKLHQETVFILYSGNRSMISNSETRAEVIDLSEEVLRRVILAKISVLSQPKSEDEKPVDVTDNKKRGAGRWSDKPFWGISSKITSFCGVVLGLAAIGALVVQGQHVFIDPHTEKVAARIDTLNHIPIMKELSEIRELVKKTDTNFAIIRSILEVTTTNDQLLKAQDRRNNPTGIR